MQDLEYKNRIAHYWLRRNGWKIGMVSGVILFVVGSMLFPEVII